MRIEGTYTFPAAIERVYGVLLDAGPLARVIPGCERLIQLGPPDAEGAVTFEMWAREATLTFQIAPVRRPDHLRLELHGRVPSGTLRGGGVIDLVAQEEHTVGAYAIDVDTPDLQVDAARSVARALCERLATELWRAAPETLPAGDLLPGLDTIREVKTPRGRIVALPRPTRLAPPAAFSTGAWVQRALWMGAGLALGLGAIALVIALVHRLASRDT